MDLKDKIKVMQHFAEGGKVEFHGSDGIWYAADAPCWDWKDYNYRIRQSPIAAGHNPHNLTEDQVECDKGWRLLEEHEIKPSVSTRRDELPLNVLQMWLSGGERWDLEFRPGGNDRSCTYRTLLYPADLAKYDIKPKTKQPLTAADFPPGTVVREKACPNDWRQVNHVTETSYWAFPWTTAQHFDSPTMMAHYEYSTDQGKTWLPCYKEV